MIVSICALRLQLSEMLEPRASKEASPAPTSDALRVKRDHISALQKSLGDCEVTTAHFRFSSHNNEIDIKTQPATASGACKSVEGMNVTILPDGGIRNNAAFWSVAALSGDLLSAISSSVLFAPTLYKVAYNFRRAVGNWDRATAMGKSDPGPKPVCPEACTRQLPNLCHGYCQKRHARIANIRSAQRAQKARQIKQARKDVGTEHECNCCSGKLCDLHRLTPSEINFLASGQSVAPSVASGERPTLPTCLSDCPEGPLPVFAPLEIKPDEHTARLECELAVARKAIDGYKKELAVFKEAPKFELSTETIAKERDMLATTVEQLRAKVAEQQQLIGSGDWQLDAYINSKSQLEAFKTDLELMRDQILREQGLNPETTDMRIDQRAMKQAEFRLREQQQLDHETRMEASRLKFSLEAEARREAMRLEIETERERKLQKTRMASGCPALLASAKLLPGLEELPTGSQISMNVATTIDQATKSQVDKIIESSTTLSTSMSCGYIVSASASAGWKTGVDRSEQGTRSDQEHGTTTVRMDLTVARTSDGRVFAVSPGTAPLNLSYRQAYTISSRSLELIMVRGSLYYVSPTTFSAIETWISSFSQVDFDLPSELDDTLGFDYATEAQLLASAVALSMQSYMSSLRRFNERQTAENAYRQALSSKLEESTRLLGIKENELLAATNRAKTLGENLEESHNQIASLRSQIDQLTRNRNEIDANRNEAWHRFHDTESRLGNVFRELEDERGRKGRNRERKHTMLALLQDHPGVKYIQENAWKGWAKDSAQALSEVQSRIQQLEE